MDSVIRRQNMLEMLYIKFLPLQIYEIVTVELAEYDYGLIQSNDV